MSLPRRAAAMCLCFAVLLAGPATAEVKSEFKNETYMVRGGTLSEIWHDIGRNGPHQRHRGLYAQALSKIRYGWSARFSQEPGDCRVEAATITLRVVTVTPRWSGAQSADRRLRRSWDRYIAKVNRHEEKHRRIAVETARQLDAAFTGAPRYRNCEAMNFYLKKTANGILERERRRQDDFDRGDPPVFLK